MQMLADLDASKNMIHRIMLLLGVDPLLEGVCSKLDATRLIVDSIFHCLVAIHPGKPACIVNGIHGALMKQHDIVFQRLRITALPCQAS